MAAGETNNSGRSGTLSYADVVNVASGMAQANDEQRSPDIALLRSFYNILFSESNYANDIRTLVLDSSAKLGARLFGATMLGQLAPDRLLAIAADVVEAARRGLLGYGGVAPTPPGNPSILGAALATLVTEPIPLSFRNEPTWAALLAKAAELPEIEDSLRRQIADALAPLSPNDRFAHVVAAIGEASEKLEVRAPFLAIRAFREIYMEPTSFSLEAQRLILDEKRPAKARITACAAMQALPSPQLGALLMAICDGVRAAKVDAKIAAEAVAPKLAYAAGRQFLLADLPEARELLAALDTLPQLTPLLERAKRNARLSQETLAAGITFEGFARSIVQLSDRAGGDTTRLLLTEDFQIIYENPMPYLAVARRAILDSGVDAHARGVALMAMQRLPEDRLIGLLSEIIDATIAGRISADKDTDMFGLVSLALAPPIEMNAYVSLFYDRADAATLLAKAGRVSSLRGLVESHRSGATRAAAMLTYVSGDSVRIDYRFDDGLLVPPL